MLRTLGRLFETPAQGRPLAGAAKEAQLRMCVAALLVHAASIDGEMSQAEQTRLAGLLGEHYDLQDAALASLIAEARQSADAAIDIFGFTSQLKRHLSEDDRSTIIEIMWRIAYADGELDAMEDNLLWRTAELLGVPSRERLALKRAVRTEAGH